MIIRFEKRQFEFTLIPVVITLLGFTLLVKLGFWQMSRAQEKQERLTQIEQRTQLSSFSLNDITKLEDPQDYPVKVAGKFNSQHVFLLDNKILDKKIGFEVVKALRTDSGELVMVNLGWIQGNRNRQEYPSIEKITGRKEFSATVYVPPADPFMLKDEELIDSWPKVLQQLDLSHISSNLGEPVLPFVLLMSEKEAIGYKKSWRAVVMKPEKHYGYALQWFGLALALLIVFVAVSHKKL